MRIDQTPQQALQQHLEFRPNLRGAAEADSGLGSAGVAAILEGEHVVPTADERAGLANVFKGTSPNDFGYRGTVHAQKAKPDSGSHTRFVASTADSDRAGDIVDQSEWELSFFKANPVIPWAHTYMIRPVGRADNIWVDTGSQRQADDVEDGRLMCDVTWDMTEGEFSAKVGRQFIEGFLHAGSVGFIPEKTASRFDLDEDDPRFAKRGNILSGNELLEFTACVVPMNGRAVAQRSFETFQSMGGPGGFHVQAIKAEIVKALQDAAFIEQLKGAFLKPSVVPPTKTTDGNGDPQDPSDPAGKSDWFTSLK